MKAKLMALCTLLCVFTAGSTTMYLANLQDLSTTSEMIVQAKVTSVVTQWSKDGSQIVTYVRCNIADDLIGDKEDNEIILAQPGGKVGTVTMEVEGTTTYKAGDDNVLFLRRDPSNSGAWQTLGLYQGRYKIYYDAGNTPRVAQEAVGAPTLLKRANLPVETGNNLSLDQFKSKIINYWTNR